ncbi:unnamed protein product [marine sediment metagenome]|uniref:Uncharacterized protein n=1 Tax=marine sediment metagenome TaxID=412755 RepID=X0XSP8_9ZZZZ
MKGGNKLILPKVLFLKDRIVINGTGYKRPNRFDSNTLSIIQHQVYLGIYKLVNTINGHKWVFSFKAIYWNYITKDFKCT